VVTEEQRELAENLDLLENLENQARRATLEIPGFLSLRPTQVVTSSIPQVFELLAKSPTLALVILLCIRLMKMESFTTGPTTLRLETRLYSVLPMLCGGGLLALSTFPLDLRGRRPF
jgi:hypothetical protein